MSGAADRGSVASSGDEREITVACISNDELVNIINGSKASLAKGVPVLIVPSSDGRLAAVAVNGLQILVPTTSVENRDGNGKTKDFSSWLLVLASLAASITYTAGLAPPGGVWGADDKANGYVAGNPVLRDKSYKRYFGFYYGNTIAFISALQIIAMLSNPKRSTIYNVSFRITVVLCLLGLVSSYVSATGVDIRSVYLASFLFGITCLIMSLQWGVERIAQSYFMILLCNVFSRFTRTT